MSSLAQLLIPALAADPNGGFAAARAQADEGLALGVGGFVLVGGEQDQVRVFTKELRQRSKTPLLIGADLERGAGQQFTGATGLPPLAAIASLNDDEALRRAARLTAREARTIGVTWNLAPVVDLDLEPANPIAGARSLGADPRTVGRLAVEWIGACQAEGVVACVKHFPGHGRTTDDSCDTLPVVRADRDTLHESDLAPFRAAIDAGVASMMTAHVAYPGLDPSGVPATLSREILTWLLRQQLRYDGLVVSDALTMKGVLDAAHGSEAEAAVRALAAGCDVLLMPRDVRGTAEALDRAHAERRLDPARVQQSIRRRLKWAQWASPPNDWRRPMAADAAWGAQLADRVIRLVQGAAPSFPSSLELMVVDDDATASAAADTTAAGAPLLDALRAGGLAPALVDGPTDGAAGPLVAALFGETRPGRGRVGYTEATRKRVASCAAAAATQGRELVVLQFAHPRLAAQLPERATVVTAWSGDRAMQQAMARWIVARRS